MKHPEHICRFNDEPQSCDCYDAGYEKALSDVGEWAESKKKTWPLWGRDTAAAEGNTTEAKNFNAAWNAALSDLSDHLTKLKEELK